MIAAHALLLLEVPLTRVLRRIQQQRSDRYRLLGEFIRGENGGGDEAPPHSAKRLHPVLLPPRSAAVGRLLRELDLPGVSVTALVRDGQRHAEPSGDLLLEAGDVLVLFGTDLDVHKGEERLLE
jgi:CPA2 family monovalent cation:H+ antiporter-2